MVQLVADWYKVDTRGAINEVNKPTYFIIFILKPLFDLIDPYLTLFGLYLTLKFSVTLTTVMLSVLQMVITADTTVLTHLEPTSELMNLPKLSLNLIVLVNLNWTWASFLLRPFLVSSVSFFFFKKSLFLKKRKILSFKT